MGEQTRRLLRNAEAHAEGFENGDLPRAPALRLAVLTCMDARVDPAALLGLDPGDAHVIRNAGGLVTDDAIRSLAISQHLLGTEEIVVIHHTDCGLLGLDDEEFGRRLEREAGAGPGWRAGGFDSREDNLREQLRRIRESPFIPRTGALSGFVYEIETGLLREVT